MKHFHLNAPVEKVKVGFGKQFRRIVSLGHNHVTVIAKEYCHMVYFGGVFIEGHGVYSYAGGVLLVFCRLGLAAGEELE